MTEQDWRARKRDATRQRIYETAMRLFEEHGYEAVSVGQIAAEAGVSVPTFYAHFPSKEHVVLPVPPGGRIAEVLATQPADLPLGERIRRAMPTWFATLPAEERPHLLARWRIVAATPSLRLKAAEHERATAALLIDALPHGEDGSVVPGDAVVATAYLSAFTAAFLTWAESNGERELEDIAAEALQALHRS